MAKVTRGAGTAGIKSGDVKWFSNANDSEIEEKIIEATIANWFEDEDASSDKVWEYFRVI